jgi:hypothetical protein
VYLPTPRSLIHRNQKGYETTGCLSANGTFRLFISRRKWATDYYPMISSIATCIFHVCNSGPARDQKIIEERELVRNPLSHLQLNTHDIPQNVDFHVPSTPPPFPNLSPSTQCSNLPFIPLVVQNKRVPSDSSTTSYGLLSTQTTLKT